jgi:hypothetical protein
LLLVRLRDIPSASCIMAVSGFLISCEVMSMNSCRTLDCVVNSG